MDRNASDPGIKIEIERLITPSGADFVDGAVLGAVGVTGAKTKILLSSASDSQILRMRRADAAACRVSLSPDL